MTTSRHAVTKAAWLEVKSKFLHNIMSSIVGDEIPDQLVINVDQTPSQFVPTDKVTMAGKNSYQARKGSIDRRGITMTLAETLSGHALPFQLIYTWKQGRLLPP